MTIVSQPAEHDTSTMGVVEQSHFDVRYIPKRVGIFRRRTEYWVELRNVIFAGPNQEFELFTLLEWIEFTEHASTAIRDERGGVRVGVLYFTQREWDFFCVGAVRGQFAPPPHAHGRAAS